jgi:hypothetical protein
MIVPMYGTVVIGRLLIFISASRFARLTQRYGRVVLEKQDVDVDEKLFGWFGCFVLMKGMWTVFRREKVESMETMEDRVRHLQVLRFLVSRRGSLGIFAVVCFPYLIIAIAYTFSDAAYFMGCGGCTATFDQAYILIAESLLVLTFCMIAARQVRDLPDPFGLMKELWYSVFFWVIALFGFILVVFVPIPAPVAYDNSLFIAIGFVGQFFLATAFQVRLGIRAEPQFGAKPVKPGNVKYVSQHQVSSNNPHGPASAVAGDTQVAPELEGILENPNLVQLFEEHLVGELGYESLLFLKDTAEWKKSYYDISPNTRLARAKRIHSTFIETNGIWSVNVPSQIQHAISEIVLNNDGDVPIEVFDRARREISRLLEMGAVVRFQKSEKYREVCSHQDILSVVVPSTTPKVADSSFTEVSKPSSV